MKKRQASALSFLLAVVLVMGILAGCSGNKKALTVFCSDDTAEGGALKYMCQRYTQEKGVEIEFVEVPFDDFQTKLLNMIKAKNAPAVVRSTEIGKYYDYLLDIGDIAPAPEEMFSLTTFDGTTYGLSANVTTDGFIYNKTLFDQAGVTAPVKDSDRWTWDEFIQAMETVVEKSDAEYGIVWDPYLFRFADMAGQFGASLFSEDLTKVTCKSPEMLECVQTFLSLFDKGLMPKSQWVGTEDPSTMFMTGKVAVYMCGNWKVGDYEKNITDFEWSPCLMPYKAERTSHIGGNYLFACKDSGMEKEAKEFLQWFYAPENYHEYCEKANYLPGRTGVDVAYDIPEIQIFVEEMNSSSSEIIKNTFDKMKAVHYEQYFEDALTDILKETVAGKHTAEECLQLWEDKLLELYPDF